MRDTIKSLAKDIKAKWPHLWVRVERGYCNTDRKVGRFRSPGKGRWGSRIIVATVDGKVLLDHNNAQTYRHTGEVRRWMERFDGSKLARATTKNLPHVPRRHG